MQYNFEWDPNKADINVRKHGISFDLAVTVFKDPMALTIFDEDNFSEEDRWVTLGQVNEKHYLLVVHTHCHHGNDAIDIRIISARSATRHEIRQYEG